MSSANQNRRTAVPIILLTLVLPLTLLIAPSLCEENKKKPATPSKAQREAIAALKNLGAVFEGGYAGGLAVRLDQRHITAQGRISKDVLAKLKTLTNLKALYVINAFGRYKMSEAGLLEFCRFFLETACDQVEFMTSLLEPGELENRIRIYVGEEIGAKRLLKGSFDLLREALRAGAFPRGEAAKITGFKDRWARRCLSRLVERKLLVSLSPKGAVKLGFPLDVVERWFPKLYPAVAG